MNADPLHPSPGSPASDPAPPAPADSAEDHDFEADSTAGADAFGIGFEEELDGELTADERSRREVGKACRYVNAACTRWLKSRGLIEPMRQGHRHSEASTAQPRDTLGPPRAGAGKSS